MIYNPYDRLSGPNFDEAMPATFAPRADMGDPEGTLRWHPGASIVQPWRMAMCRYGKWFVNSPSPAGGIPVAWSTLLSRFSSGELSLYTNGNPDTPLQKQLGQTFVSSGGNFDACIAVAGADPYETRARQGLSAPASPHIMFPYPDGTQVGTIATARQLLTFSCVQTIRASNGQVLQVIVINVGLLTSVGVVKSISYIR